MTEDEAYKVHIQYTFNAFCKVVIRHAAIDIILKLRRRRELEVSLDYLMNEKFVQLAEPEQLEEYFFTDMYALIAPKPPCLRPPRRSLRSAICRGSRYRRTPYARS